MVGRVSCFLRSTIRWCDSLLIGDGVMLCLQCVVLRSRTGILRSSTGISLSSTGVKLACSAGVLRSYTGILRSCAGMSFGSCCVSWLSWARAVLYTSVELGVDGVGGRRASTEFALLVL